jgi:signal transduction histidine kinase/CheY-like chemotaxis protein
LIPEELHQAEREVLDRLRRGESVQSEVERVRKDGQRIWISLSVSPLRDPAGQIVGAASIKRDVTAERLAAERLRETQRLRVAGQLAGGIAHEANNQMLVVLGAAEFILRRPELSATVRQDLDAIRQAAQRTAAITQQLLAFSRRQPVSVKDVDVDAVVRELEPVLRRSLHEHHQLTLALDLEGAWVRLDARQLEQVLLNLTLNARDAMPEGGRLTIRTFRAPPGALGDGPAAASEGYACLTVEDTGVGMDARTLERAFEPFFTTKEVGQGTGLGLSVVDGLIHQMGGTIRVTSVAGRGSTFTLYLPLVAPAPAAEGSDHPGRTSSGGGRVVLVVEDEANVRAIAARTLREAGYVVHEAQHGGEALSLIRGGSLGRLDLVITDLGMPVMRGETLAEHLRTERPGLPVLYISGYTDTGGVEPFLQKPFAPAQLLGKVATVLGADENGRPTPPSA